MRIGILGLGSAGLRHFRAFRKIPDVAVVGADLDEHRRAQVEAEGGATVTALETLLRKRPEAVVIAVPHASLAGAALQALEAGAHVLLEKPMATSLEDASRVVDRARVLERRVMVSFVHRFRPDVAAARDLIARGEIGSPVFLTDTMASGASEMPPWVWDRARAGGGMMLYNGIHQVDRARFLLGEEVDTVRAEVRALAHDVDTEDTVAALLGFRSGAVSVVLSTRRRPMRWRGGRPRSSAPRAPSGSARARNFPGSARGAVTTLPGAPEDRFYSAASEFVAAIREDRAPPLPRAKTASPRLRSCFGCYADGRAFPANAQTP